MSDLSDTQPTAKTQPTNISDDSDASTARRAFLRRLAIGGGVALGVGGLAAYLVEQNKTTVVVLPGGESVAVPAGTGVDETLDLINEMAALKAALADSDASRRDLEGQLSAAQAEIDRLTQSNNGLLSLVDLYEALEAAGLDDLVGTGLLAMNAGMATARGLIRLLESGAGKGVSILEGFIEAFPTPQEGLIWLKGEVSALLLNLQTLTERIREAIDPIEDFAKQVTEFVISVLRRLPFGLGSPFAGGLETMQSIITGLPTTAEGITTAVLTPLDDWFGQDNQKNLVGTLANPIQDDLIAPANSIVTSFDQLDQSYQSDLVTPVQSALDERAGIRSQIEAQRAQLGAVLVARGNRSVSQS